MQKLLAGQPWTRRCVYFRTVPKFETSAPELQWLTRAVFVGTGERYPTEVVVRFWRVDYLDAPEPELQAAPTRRPPPARLGLEVRHLRLDQLLAGHAPARRGRSPRAAGRASPTRPASRHDGAGHEHAVQRRRRTAAGRRARAPSRVAAAGCSVPGSGSAGDAARQDGAHRRHARSAAPMLRENWLSEVAMPSCERGRRRAAPRAAATASGSPCRRRSRARRRRAAALARVLVEQRQADEPRVISTPPVIATTR